MCDKIRAVRQPRVVDHVIVNMEFVYQCKSAPSSLSEVRLRGISVCEEVRHLVDTAGLCISKSIWKIEKGLY